MLIKKLSVDHQVLCFEVRCWLLCAIIYDFSNSYSNISALTMLSWFCGEKQATAHPGSNYYRFLHYDMRFRRVDIWNFINEKSKKKNLLIIYILQSLHFKYNLSWIYYIQVFAIHERNIFIKVINLKETGFSAKYYFSFV